MNNENVLEQIEVLEQKNTIDSYYQIIGIIDNALESAKYKEKHELEIKKLQINIKILQLKLQQLGSNNYQEEINLRGKLINLYKQAESKTKEQTTKMQIKHEIVKELKIHKKTINEYRKNKDSKISISKKVGLNILEISKSIEIFMKEKDVLTKVKNIAKETVVGTISAGIIMAGTSLIMQTMTGIPFTLSSIVSIMPVIAYIGLSSIIRNLTNKTEFEQYEYQQSEEYKASVEAFGKENKDCINEIAKIIKEKKSVTNIESIVAVNERLIEKLDSLVNSTDIRGVREAYALQSLSFFRENKEYCEQIIDNYLEERNNDVEKYNNYREKLRTIHFEIFKRGNSIPDAIKDSGKNMLNNTKVMLIAKAILSCVFPNMCALDDIKSLLVPFAFIIINGIIDIPTYRNKLKFKETDYQGKIKLKNKQRIEEILDSKTPQPKLA